jgi:hypothetical protein
MRLRNWTAQITLIGGRLKFEVMGDGNPSSDGERHISFCRDIDIHWGEWVFDDCVVCQTVL